MPLPKTIQNQPVRYLWKEVIRAGRYVHPLTRRAIDITTQRIDRWIANFRRMQSAGVKVYVPVNHSLRTEDNRGYVVDARRRDQSLELLHQFIGPDAIRDAARSEISLRIVRDFRDGLGNVYDEAIEHSSLVVDPVIPAQAGFHPALGHDIDSLFPPSDPTNYHKGSSPMPTSEQVAAIQSLLADDPTAVGLTPDNALDVLIAYVRDLRQQLDLSRQTEQTVAQLQDDLNLTRRALADKESQLHALGRVPAMPDDDTLLLLGRSLRSERDAAIAAGAITPAVADEIDQLFCDQDKPTLLALSRNGASADPIAFRIYAILRKNKPLDMSQRTGVQTLSRVTPDPDNSPLPYEQMAARYNTRL